MKNRLSIQKKALEFRRSISRNQTEPLRLKSLLQELNVLTIFKPMSKAVSGMALKIMSDGSIVQRFMLINSNQTIGRQHFTIGHELYHLYIQENFSSMVCTTGMFDRKSGEEYAADWFAAYFLLPTEGLLKLIPDQELSVNKITLRTILSLEQYFSCSRLSLLYRLRQEGLINEQKIEEYRQDVILSARLYGFDTTLYQSGNQDNIIGDYGQLAKSLIDKEQLSEGDYTNLMFDIGININADLNDSAN